MSWLTIMAMTGSSLPVSGVASWPGGGPMADRPSSAAARSSSMSGIAAVIFWRLALASSSWAVVESFGV
jgi:hypothetical protein